jgi:hypothetical protein
MGISWGQPESYLGTPGYCRKPAQREVTPWGGTGSLDALACSLSCRALSMSSETSVELQAERGDNAT